MTPQDFDKIAARIALGTFDCLVGPSGMNTTIRASLIEAWNAALDEAARACDKVKDGSIYNAVDIEFDDDAGAVDVCAAAFRAMKLPTEGR